MALRIRRFHAEDAPSIVELSLRAWAPVFESIEQALGNEIFRRLHPDWRVSQQEAVERVCASEKAQVWVGEEDRVTAGFVALYLDPESTIGEIYMLAVDPGYQALGIGTSLTSFALDRIREAGKTVALVETGGDPGHAPARRTYEKADFRHVSVARYFKAL